MPIARDIEKNNCPNAASTVIMLSLLKSGFR